MIEVNNLTRSPVNEALLKKVATAVLRKEKEEGKELSIAIVGPKRMRELNKKYRKKDKVARVLSFPNGKESTLSGVKGYGLGEIEGCLGEVVICPQEVKKDARKYGMIFEKALAWMLVHGILHLLGYDHAKERDAKHMEQKEHLYLSRL